MCSSIIGVFLLCTAIALSSALSTNNHAIISLQSPHPPQTPSSVMSLIEQECRNLGIEKFDVYGDFDTDPNESYLRTFEAEVSRELGMEDAVFMPSGVMAQSIALLIHAGKEEQPFVENKVFSCHCTSHLLLHEEHGYRELLHMDALVLPTCAEKNGMGYGGQPLCFSDVETAVQNFGENDKTISTLILELPHHELGGKLTPWEDILLMRDLCLREGIKFHCDGARLFEAAAGYRKTPRELCEPFDSVYISFYKGLGGISGAMLLGQKDVCSQARAWLRRFGGNLWTLMPFAVSGWAAFRKHVMGVNRQMTFLEKKEKMVKVVSALNNVQGLKEMIAFDPAVPQTNMVHVFIRATVQDCLDAADDVARRTGVRVFHRVREVDVADPAFRLGYRTKLEWAIGDANGMIEDETFLSGWKELVMVLLDNR